MARAIIVGGGVTGLACGDALADAGWDVTVLESRPRLGGMAATISVDGFRFDMGPHKLYSPMPDPVARVRGLFPGGEGLLSIPKVSQLHFRGRDLAYPLSMRELLRAVPPSRAVAMGASWLAARTSSTGPAPSYATFMRRQFGRVLYAEVFGPAARKVFGEDERLSSLLGEARFKGKSLATFVRQALRGPRIDAAEFLYPGRGTGEVPERLRRRIEARGGRVRLDCPVDRVACDGGRARAVTAGGEVLSLDASDALVMTSPLREAPDLLGLSSSARDAARALGHRLLVLVYVMLRVPSVTRNQWMFFPEADVCFNRLSEPRNFSPEMAPPGRTSLVAEVTAWPGEPPSFDASAVTRVLDDLVRLGLIRQADVLGVHTERLEAGYPVWTVGFEGAREAVLAEIDGIENVYPLGRHGLYQYVGIMDCVDMALRAARHIASREPRGRWPVLRRELEGYPVVD